MTGFELLLLYFVNFDVSNWHQMFAVDIRKYPRGSFFFSTLGVVGDMFRIGRPTCVPKWGAHLMFKNSFNTWDDDPIIELVMGVSCICFYTQLVCDVDGSGVMFSDILSNVYRISGMIIQTDLIFRVFFGYIPVQVLKERIRELESSQGRTHMAGESAATVGDWKISGYIYIYTHTSYIYIYMYILLYVPIHIYIYIYIHIDTHHVQRKSWTRFCQVRPWSFLDDSLVDLKHMNSVSHAQAAAKAPMGQRQKKKIHIYVWHWAEHPISDH